MRIGLDFDGVIADAGKLKSEGALKLYGLSIPPEKFKKELVVGEGHLSADQYRELQKVIYETEEVGFLMELVEECDLHLGKLMADGHTIIVVTARSNVSLEVARNWANIQGLKLEFVGVGYGISKAAAACECDVFVDDDLDKLEQLVGIVPNLFLYGWPYNAHIDHSGTAVRVTSWSELYDHIKALNSPPMPDWAPSNGPWCLNMWLPLGVPDAKVDTCLLALGHDEPRCRGISGDWYDRDNAVFLGTRQLAHSPAADNELADMYPGGGDLSPLIPG